MNSTTVDFGIDLGTTNSAIALLKGVNDIEVYRNNEGFEYTPSAVWIDKNQRLYVGRRAMERLEDDPENAFCEFKLQMGTDTVFTFARSGKQMKPEELSAEVLKSLRADVRQRTGEEVRNAVITVPAAFELPQCEATMRAAQAAGLEFSPLVQEPVAAALAYGLQNESEKAYWLVYDLGGGTFDAALIQPVDGEIQVVNHAGDNHLGGKLIDWEIVEKYLIPAVIKENKVTDFRRGNAKWRAAVAKLKLHAEQAKIRLSRDESSSIIIPYLDKDDDGDPIAFEYELQRRDVEAVVGSAVRRSVNICKRVLAEKNLSPSHVQKLLLVGGPTLTPYLRQALADPGEGLGIPLEFNVDPLTIVARGAAMFAGAQQKPRKSTPPGGPAKPAAEGTFAIALKYDAAGMDSQPLVGGEVKAPSEGTNLAGYTIEFISAESRPPWRSGKIALKSGGAFMTNLLAQRKDTTVYAIELMDAAGERKPVEPATFQYRWMPNITGQPLIHSLGIALADNEVDWLFRKGIPLPAKKRTTRRTTVNIAPGQQDKLIRIVVIEGEKDRADRNAVIGSLEIAAGKLKRELPTGSKVEITLDIDASRLIRTGAYIELLDQEFEAVLKLEKKAPDPAQLNQRFAVEKERLEKLKAQAEQINHARAKELLQRIEEEKIVREIANALNAAAVDRDAADKSEKRLLELRNAVDEIEDLLEWPNLVASVAEAAKSCREWAARVRADQQAGKPLMGQINVADCEQQIDVLEREAGQAGKAKNPDALRHKVKQLWRIAGRLLMQLPDFWVWKFQDLEPRRDRMSNPSLAAQLFAQGQRAINAGELPVLQDAVSRLFDLLPPEEAQSLDANFKGIHLA
jgi:molecular chaperone DnaK